jgi:tetratricopeptide (TPR) repeat protein
MKDIRAFVGHSFTDDDAGVVSAFLKYFDQLSKLHPTFTWEHAEKAEPRILTEKVLRIIADKNLFIGICTRKEHAVANVALTSMPFQPQYAKARKTDFRSKTSDWIIQEIGMAIGRGLALILLVEDGVSDPGGLQGDVEYIRFNRDAPEKSFGKLLEMITALSPKSAVEQTTSADILPASSEEIASNDLEDYTTPTATWTRDNYEIAAIHLAIIDNQGGIERVNQAYTATPDATVGDNRMTWLAHVEYARLYFGKGGSLTRLKKLSDDLPHNDVILSYLGRVYASYDRHRESAEHFFSASQATHDPEKIARYISSAAKQYAADGDFNKARSLTDTILSSTARSNITEPTVLDTLYNLLESEKNIEAAVAVLERIVEVKPDDFTSRFNLAYKHSGIGNKDVALHHYLQIPYQERTSIAWNNLGVSYSEFKLNAKSIAAYRRAEVSGETLAMSNLGYQFMQIGFIEEAKAQCSKALATENPHKNVSQLLAQLTALPDEENTKLEEVLKDCRPKVTFYKKLGAATARTQLTSITPNWQSPECMLQATHAGQTIRFKGSFERDVNSLAAGLLSGLGGPVRKERHHIEFSATIVGHALFGTIKRESEKGALSAASSMLLDGSTKALMMLSDDGKEISVMENPQSISPTFFVLTAAA